MSAALPVWNADAQSRAVDVLSDWRFAPRASYPCPCCGAAGVAIEDRSARPHAEWYHFACSACGLDETLNIPLGSRPPSLD